MAKPNTLFEAQAREAHARLEAARAAGEQLALPLPDEGGRVGEPEREARAVRGPGRAASQLRNWAAAKGLRMPEDVLAEIAGMTAREDVFLAAMQRSEQVLLWAAGEHGRATPAQRMDMFKLCLTAAIRAAEALLPYGLAKVQPDDAPAAPVQVVIQTGGAVPAAVPQAIDVTPGARRIAPPPMPHEIQRNQALAAPVSADADGAARTDEASR